MGFSKFFSRLADRYHRPNMRDTIREYGRSCEISQRTIPKNHKPVGLLSPLEQPVSKWTYISITLIFRFLESTKEHAGLIVTVDRPSKKALFIFFGKRLDAVKTSQLFKNHVYRLHGLPPVFVSDRDRIFTRKFWTESFKLFWKNWHPYQLTIHRLIDKPTIWTRN